MKIIKRNGAEVPFDIQKIEVAVTKANNSVAEADRMTPVQIGRIAESVELQCQKMNRAPTVEEIQDMVEHHIMAHGAFEVAKHYITYRYTRSLVRRANTTDDKILSLIECNNEEAKQENSNKNPVVNSTQRDYMAGEVSRDITNRLLLPQDIVEAHEEGIIHFHDTDYFAQHKHNCDLVNLEDMLQNGTVITGTMIEKPHSFATACNIATQIVAQVASNQYGGQSISLTHLAPFVQISREKIRASVRDEFDAVGVAVTEDKINSIAEKRLREELRRFDRKVVVLDDDPTGVQTVHDVSEYNDWTEETFRAGLESNARLFFVLTNSRSCSAGETTRVHREIAEHLAAASQKTGVPFVLISRSDSTLRGHFPLETETLRTELEALLPEHYDGEILLPFFLEGGRYTLDKVHYVREGGTLVPAGEEEYARDATFTYRASDLTEWCQEKTGGAYPAEQVVSISLDELRRRDYDAVCEKLMGVSGFNKVVVNAVCYDDVAVFVTAYLRAAARGKVFMFRSSAAVVKVLGAVSDQPLLRREDLMCADQRNGGIIVVGSHVRKTTMQLEALQKGCPEIEYICFDVNTVFDDAALATERRRILDRTNTLLADGTTVAVYTSRMVLRSEDDQREKNLAISV